MVFKNLLISGLCLGLVAITACTPSDELGSKKDEDIIGKKVEAVTDIQYSDGENLGVLAVFDEVIRKIHQFDLASMKHLRSIDVKNPSQDHYLLHDSQGQYTVDLTKKHLSIYKNDGSVQHDPVRFLGKPVSTSFRPQDGFLILYDDLYNVSILQLAANGDVVRTLVLGPIVGEDNRVQSGEITTNGKLVLAMADGSLFRVDLNATLDAGDWVFDPFNTTLTDIRWVAPVPGNSDQAMIRSYQSIAVYDFSTSAVVSQITTTKRFAVFKYSKDKDPHIIFAERSYSGFSVVDDSTLTWKNSQTESFSLAYLNGSSLKQRPLPKGDTNMLLSHLDLSTNTWSVVRGAVTSPYDYNGLNTVRSGRRLSKTAFSNGGALAEDTLPNNTVLKLSRDYVFALFPSELGYAQRIDINSGEVKELKLFNLKHIGRK